MYALGCTPDGASDGITCPGQSHFEQRTTAHAQKESKLRGAGAVRYRFDNARPSRTPQGDAGVAG